MSSPAEVPPSGSGGKKVRRLDAIPPRGFRARKAAAEAGLTQFPMHHPAVRPLRVEKKRKGSKGNEGSGKRGKGRREGPHSPEDGPMSRGEEMYRKELAEVTAGNQKESTENLVLMTRELLLKKESLFRSLEEWNARKAKMSPEELQAYAAEKQHLKERMNALEAHDKLAEAFNGDMELPVETPDDMGDRVKGNIDRIEKGQKKLKEAKEWLKAREEIKGSIAIARENLKVMRGGNDTDPEEELTALYGEQKAKDFADSGSKARGEQERVRDALEYLQLFTDREGSESAWGTWKEWSMRSEERREKALDGTDSSEPYPYTVEQDAGLTQPRVYEIDDKKGRSMEIRLASGEKSDEVVLPAPDRAVEKARREAPPAARDPNVPPSPTDKPPAPGERTTVQVVPNPDEPPKRPETGKHLSPEDVAFAGTLEAVKKSIGDLMDPGNVNKNALLQVCADLEKSFVKRNGYAQPRGRDKKALYEDVSVAFADMVVDNGLHEAGNFSRKIVEESIRKELKKAYGKYSGLPVGMILVRFIKNDLPALTNHMKAVVENPGGNVVNLFKPGDWKFLRGDKEELIGKFDDYVRQLAKSA